MSIKTSFGGDFDPLLIWIKDGGVMTVCLSDVCWSTSCCKCHASDPGM